jgi:hypothetical protein
MRISRNDKTPLASFDEDDYINNTNANERNLQGLLTEMALVRQTIALFKSFQKDNYLEWVFQIILFQFELFYYYCAPDASSKIFQERYL